MKMERLMGILTVLLRQEQVTAPALAARFEVSRRTINRDIDDLCRAGIPLVTTQGFGGGISIAEGYRIDKTLLSEEELQTVFAALRGLDSVAKTPHTLADKLLGRRCVEAEDVILIDLASHYQASLREKIEVVRRAVAARETVAFHYVSPKGESERTVEPYRLVFQWSSWYLLGYCLQNHDFRLFKLNRLWQLAPTGAHFTPREIPPEKLDFGGHLAGGTIHLEARFDRSEKYRLIEEYGIDCCRDDGQALHFAWDFVSYEVMRQWVLSFGDRVLVLQPPRLRADLRNQAQRLQQLYESVESP